MNLELILILLFHIREENPQSFETNVWKMNHWVYLEAFMSSFCLSHLPVSILLCVFNAKYMYIKSTAKISRLLTELQWIHTKKEASFSTDRVVNSMCHLVIIFVLSVFVYSHFTTLYCFLFQCWQPDTEFVLSLLSSN